MIKKAQKTGKKEIFTEKKDESSFFLIRKIGGTAQSQNQLIFLQKLNKKQYIFTQCSGKKLWYTFFANWQTFTHNKHTGEKKFFFLHRGGGLEVQNKNL